MQETLINFETAVLAKEKNFNIPTHDYFMGSGKAFEDIFKVSNHNDASIYTKEKYNRPTQSLLQKWLREVHNIHIEISFNLYLYNAIICATEQDLEPIILSSSLAGGTPYTFHTYEEALEVALQESLKLIK